MTVSVTTRAGKGSALTHNEMDANFTALRDGVNELDTNFASRVRAAVLTGLSTATNAAISATDSVLVALGKLQAQINAKADAATVVQVSSSRALASSDNGKVLECTTSGVTLTMPNSGMPADFACAIIPNGTTSVASAGTALLNGATTTLTRAAASNPMFAVQARASAANSYVVSGS